MPDTPKRLDDAVRALLIEHRRLVRLRNVAWRTAYAGTTDRADVAFDAWWRLARQARDVEKRLEAGRKVTDRRRLREPEWLTE